MASPRAKYCSGVLAFGLALLPEPSAGAQTSPAPPPKPPAHWTGSVGVGLTGLAGNTDSLAWSGRLELGMQGSLWELDFDGDASVIQMDRDDDEEERKRAEDHEIDSSLRRAIGKRTYVSLKGSFDREPLNGVDSQVSIGAGFGYRVRSADRVQLRIEAGAAHEDDRREEASVRYPSLYFTSNASLDLPSRASLSWSNDLKWSTEDGSAFTSDQELDLESPLTKRLAVSILLDWEYDSDPSPGYGRDDLKVVAKLTWNLWTQH
jgi:putative salt-induced outer membrane protein YdiY